MAANTSFKVACPSCEASVPIRDPNLVGKKIDCPKCKYRFVVEDPNGDEVDEAPAPKKGAKVRRRGAEESRPRPKAKSGNNNVLILGSILGLVALAILGVGGYFLFFAGGDSTGSTGSTGGQARTSTVPVTPPLPVTDTQGANPADPDAPTPPVDGAANPATPAAPDAPPAPPAAAPSSPTVANAPAPGGVYRTISNLLPGDSHNVMMIDMDRMRNCTLGQQAFESRVGFRPETFKTKLGIGPEEMTRFLRTENLELNTSFNVIRTKRPVKMAELQSAMQLKPGPKSPIQGRAYFQIPPNDLLDHLATILQSELESREAKKPGNETKAKTAQPLGLVMLDPTTVVIASLDVLEEFLNAGCKFELKSRPAPGAGDAPADGAVPPPGGDVPPPGGDGQPGPAGRPKPGGRGGDSDGGAGGVPLPGTATPEGGGQPGGNTQFATKLTYLTVDPKLKGMMDRLEEGEEVIAAVAQLLQTDRKVVERVRDLTGIKQLEVRGMDVLGVVLNNVNVQKLKAQIQLDMFREPDAKALEEEVKRLLPPAGQLLGLFLGGLRISVEGGDGGSGGGGVPGAPAGGGAVSGDGAPPPRGGPPSGGPPSGSPPSGDPNDPNNPGGGSGDGPRSTMGVTRRARTVQFDIDLSLNERAYDRIYALTEGAVIRMKGMVEMSDGKPRWHELAAAAIAMPKDGVVPRGTFARDETLGGRLSRTFPPNQRVSWMANLLPFLGQDELFNRIDKKKSWRDEENLKQGAVLIPQFLNASYPRPAWRAHVPSLGVRDQGATHYVGMAGVGLDAADYRFADKASEKKLGIFGYERRTALKDVTDGLANTIYIIQVPPTYPRPWLAGGGATIQGVPETKSAEPFVTLQGNDKRGTYALMADGTVRFIKADISDEVFKALCTIKGGEEVDVNKEASKVDPPKGSELKTTGD